MDNGKGNGNAIEKLKKLKRYKKLLVTFSPLLGIVLVLGIVLIATFSIWGRTLPIFTTSSMVGIQTIYDNTKLVNDLNSSIENWSEEERFVFDELKRQKEIWHTYYQIYGLGGNVDKDTDLVKLVIPIQYQGAVNPYSFGEYYPNEENADGTMSNDYEGEVIVSNRDTRNFYKQAGERLGSTFLLSPNNRMMFGNMISANIAYTPVKYTGYNANEIISDWAIVSKMYSPTENSINSSYHNSKTAEANFNNALALGYNRCNSDDLDDWIVKNSCWDYDLMFKENNVSKTENNLESLLDNAFSNAADIPPASASGMVVGAYYYAVHVERKYDEYLYDEYLKNVYIPALFKDYEADKVFIEMKQLEQIYRYYNDDVLMNISLDSGASIGGGTYDVPNVEYNCAGGKLPNLATYPGHGGIDINGVAPGTTVYPLFPGVVYSVSHDNNNCYPRLNSAGGYTCSHCSGTGYGNLVIIKGTAANGEEYYTYYGHLNNILVSQGQEVDVNTPIGGVGNTGCSTGAHLHLELRKTSTGSKVFANTIYNNTAVASVLCGRTSKEEV